MIGKLVKSTSRMKWVPFMIQRHIGYKFFGLIKTYNYYYVHPSIPELPINLYDLKIGDWVEFYLVTEYHARLVIDENKLCKPINKINNGKKTFNRLDN